MSCFAKLASRKERVAANSSMDPESSALEQTRAPLL